MDGYIYKYENKLNHKVYIGQTTDLNNRRASHKYKAEFEKTKFYNAVRKYGWNSFDYSIIAQIQEVDKDKLTAALDNLEIEYIAYFDSFNNGYNSTQGGHSYRGKIVSEAFREYCRNRTYSEETRKKFSIASSNRIVTPETREKLRKNAIEKNIVARLNRDTEKRDNNRKEALSKKVLQIDSNGTVVNEFASIKDAAIYILDNLAKDKKFHGIEHGIHRHCTHKTKKRFYYGFEWRFKTNV